jgi:ribosomal-protein-alanine N-acetyltransferase
VTRILRWEPHQSVRNPGGASPEVESTKCGYIHVAVTSRGARSWAPFPHTSRASGDSIAERVLSGPRLWGEGVQTEALKAVLDYMFSAGGRQRMEAVHAVEIPASGR